MHYDSVRTVCHRIVVNKADAEDATQHALISIVRALPGFDGRSKFSTWVYRIATNAALDEVRRIRRRPTPTDIDATFVLPVADATGAVDAQMDVAQALALLPEEYRTTLVLRHVADLDYEEIAEIQGFPWAQCDLAWLAAELNWPTFWEPRHSPRGVITLTKGTRERRRTT